MSTNDVSTRPKPVPLRSEEEACDAGYDCGMRGANTRNCHFTYFGSKALMHAWERGQAAGKREKKP